jgi:hypothetical protein
VDKLYRGELRTVQTLNKGISWGKEGGNKEAQVLRDGLGAHLKEQDQVSSCTIAEPQLLRGQDKDFSRFRDKSRTSSCSRTRPRPQLLK